MEMQQLGAVRYLNCPHELNVTATAPVENDSVGEC